MTNDAYFRYRDIEVDKSGIYSSFKYGENLSRNTFQEKNDVIKFSIDVVNKKDSTVKLNKILDAYTYNMSPYSDKYTINNDSTSKEIDNEYLSDELDLENKKIT